MVAISLALVAAIAYGLSDFVGGIVARVASAWTAAVIGSATAAVLTAGVAVSTSGQPTVVDLAWGAVAGVATGVGGGFLYRGFAAGRMGVVGPISAVGAAVVPIVVGVATGERPAPLAWLGILVALPGIWLVSREPASSEDQSQATDVTAAGLLDGVLAGLGFGVLFAALGQIPERAGYWPLALTQAVAVPAVIVLATVLREAWVPTAVRNLHAAWCGVLSVVATIAFAIAAQRGELTIAGVLTSLYPAVTIMLAATFLREPVHRVQAIGLALCGLCVVCVAAA